MSYPEGQVEDQMGVYEWTMTDEDTISVISDPLMINQVPHEGGATLHRKNGWFVVALCEDIYLHRLGEMGDPTQAASRTFRDRVVEVANQVDCRETRQRAKIARLRKERETCACGIVALQEEILGHTKRIVELQQELALLDESL